MDDITEVFVAELAPWIGDMAPIMARTLALRTMPYLQGRADDIAEAVETAIASSQESHVMDMIRGLDLVPASAVRQALESRRNLP